jgi:hypothetical protein
MLNNVAREVKERGAMYLIDLLLDVMIGRLTELEQLYDLLESLLRRLPCGHLQQPESKMCELMCTPQTSLRGTLPTQCRNTPPRPTRKKKRNQTKRKTASQDNFNKY